jgi:uncharacterized membrane protein YebE (DUF533 family)
MARKITKKEIEKPDSFQTALSKIATYVSANKSKIYLASGIVILVHNFFRLVLVQDEL